MTSPQFTEGDNSLPTFTAFSDQLLPNIVDGIANTRPSSAYAMIPKSFTSYEEGYRTVTYEDLANAINGVAWMLSKRLESYAKPQTLAYVGPNDIGYICFILGAVKAGHLVMALSPRNTKADHASLFAATKCTTVLTLPAPYGLTVHTILGSLEHTPEIIHIPTIYELLDGEYPHFPYPKTYAAAKNEPLVVVHTSGTTNIPKVITYTHAFGATYHRWQSQPPPEGYANVIDRFNGVRAFTTFPFFHAGGLMVNLLKAIPTTTTMVSCLAGVPPSAAGIVEALNYVQVDCVHMPAPFAEQIAKDPELLRVMTRQVHSITYGGGDVSESCAQAFLSAGVYVAGFNGSTETAPYPIIRPLRGFEAPDLKYIQPHPCGTLVFEPTAFPEFFELVLKKNPPGGTPQPVFTIFPHLTEFHTKDLFSPHPSNPDMWLYRGRADDMIIAATGENCNPTTLEQEVALHPEIAAVLMIGTGRYQKSLLVEPTDEAGLTALADRERFIEGIWPTVEAANQRYPKFSHVARSHIMLTHPGRPLRRAGKGTVQRAPSLVDYREEIDRLYADAGDGVGDRVVQPYEIHVSMGNGRMNGK